MTTKYTIADFNQDFPNNDVCLQYLFDLRFPNGGTCRCGKTDCFHRVAKRKKFACAWCGHQVSPTSGTIFHKSKTPLRTWFHAMFLITASRNGVSAMELMRQTGVCYETAWRINHQIRALMKGESGLLKGIVEADETYLGGRRPGKRGRGAISKVKIAGLLERGGDIIATVIPDCKAKTLVPNIAANVAAGATIYTDAFCSYNSLALNGFKHGKVRHSSHEYVNGVIHTNGVESFWGQFKRSVNGTFHHVSPQHCQKYLNEFSFRHNHRHEGAPLFLNLISKVGEQTPPAV